MTQHELEARIRKIEDIEEIKNLQARYCYLIDTLQGEKVLDLFADKFTAEYVPLATYTTKAELLEFLNGAGKGTSMMCHQAMTPLIEVDGDKATGTWYLFGPFTNRMPKGEVANWVQGRYDNDYVREDGKWKFSHLRFKFNIQSPYEDGWVKTRMMLG
jgi:hypothetical protein